MKFNLLNQFQDEVAKTDWGEIDTNIVIDKESIVWLAISIIIVFAAVMMLKKIF